MPTANKEPAWSYSALTAFESCPKKFWHFKIKRDFKDEGGPDSWYGQEVHNEIAAFLNKGQRMKIDKVHIQGYVEHYKNIKMEFVGAEIQMAINKDMDPVGWFDDDVWCRAIIDAAWISRSDGVALLVDWKTGKMKPDEKATQLMLAACLFMMRMPEIHSVSMRYVWLTAKGKPTSFTLTRSNMSSVWNELAPRLKRYVHAHKHDEFPAQPSGLCRKHCPVTSCPHHGG